MIRTLFRRSRLQRLDYTVNSVCDSNEILSVLPLGGFSRATDSYAAGFRRPARFIRHTIFIERNANFIKRVLNHTPGNVRMSAGKIKQEQVVIGAACYYIVSQTLECFAHHSCVFYHGMNVLPVFLSACFLRCCRFSSDNVLQRTSLATWEDGAVDLFRKLRLTENHSSA